MDDFWEGNFLVPDGRMKFLQMLPIHWMMTVYYFWILGWLLSLFLALENRQWKVSEQNKLLEKLEDEMGLLLNKGFRKLVVFGAGLVPIFRAFMILLVVYLVFHLLPWVIVFFGGGKA